MHIELRDFISDNGPRISNINRYDHVFADVSLAMVYVEITVRKLRVTQAMHQTDITALDYTGHSSDIPFQYRDFRREWCHQKK